jgi:DNA end-binding protein Ku
MPRSIWGGTISFGMVSIPVNLFAATQDKDISFHLLHEECGNRLKQLRWCPYHERAVEWDEVARGYEYAKDGYIVLSDEDFDKLPLPSKHTIELSAFVRSQEIDPIYYEKGYYLEPKQEGAKAYALLMRVLEEKRLVGLAKIAIRNKEQLCALRPQDGTLVLETLYYPDEIRVEKGVENSEVRVSEREMEMATTLVDVLSERFDPTKYHDEYRQALMELIEAKQKGQEIVPPPAPAGKVIDLMAALRESVEAAKKRRPEESRHSAYRQAGERRKAG